MTSPVPDIRLVQNVYFPKYNVTMDWSLLPDGTLDDTQALATSVCVALGTNARADTTDPLPDPDSTDYMGWWGDLDADTIWGAWPIGSKIWLLQRSAIEGPNAQRGATIELVRMYIQQAIQPFVDNHICSRFDITVVRPATPLNQINSMIRIYRGPQPPIELMYSILWEEQKQATGH
jgi:phage gp46-like protein